MAIVSRVALYGVVLAALLVGALYVVVERTEYWRASAIGALEERAQAEAEVKRADARLSAYNVKIDFREVTLRFADASEATKIGRMVIDVDLWQSLWRGEWAVSTVSIFDTQWNVTTDAAGRIESNLLLAREDEGTTILVDAAIAWTTPEGRQTLPPALIAVRTAGETTTFDLRLRESSGRADATRLSGEVDFIENMMSKRNADEEGWSARARFEAQAFDLGVWRARLPFIKLGDGVLSAKLDIERTRDGEVRVGGDARLENYQLWDEPHTIGGRVQSRWGGAQTFVSISDLLWDSAAATWRDAQARVWDDANGRVQVSIHAPQVERKEFDMGDFSVTALRASVDARGRLSEAVWNAMPTSDDIREMRIRARGEAFELAFGDTRERYEEFDVALNWTAQTEGFALNIDELSATRDGSRYQSTGRVVFAGDRGLAQASVFVDALDVAQFQHWANELTGARAEGDAELIHKRLRRGFFRDAHLFVEAPIRDGRMGASSIVAARGRIAESEWEWPTRDGGLRIAQVDADFRLSDDSFSTTVRRARVNDMSINAQYEAQYETRAHTPRTAMTATVVGEIDEMMTAMRSLGAARVADLGRHIQFFGPAKVIVSAVSTQSELSAHDFRGELVVDGVRAHLAQSTRAALENLSGSVRFASQAIETGDLRGRVNDAPIRIKLGRQRGDMVASAEGELDLFDWLHAGGVLDGALASSARSIIRGAARWKGEWRDTPQGVSIKLRSNLRGAEVRLPAPFGLRKDDARLFELRSAAEAYQMRYGEGDRMLSARVATRKGAPVGGLRIGPGKLLFDDEKMIVRGRVPPSLNIAEWLSFFPAGAAGASPHWDVGIEFAEASILEQTVRNASLRLVSDENNLFMSVASTPLQGVLLKQRNTNVSLEHLHIPNIPARDDEGAESWPIDPSNIPAFNLTISDLRIGESAIHDLSGEMRPIADGVAISDMRFMTTANTVNFNGLWTLRDGEAESRFTFEILSNDFGQFLRNNDLLDNIEGGKGSASGELVWRGAPWNFELENASGGILLNLQEGQLRHTELGVGRLVGLFNAAAVVRRINLDFKDVFAQGLSFDTMRGSFQIRDKNVHISGLEIDGLSTNIRLKGRTGLAARDYDQRMRVIVKLREGLPVVGALVGGPLAAIGVYLVDQITNVAGMLDQVATLEYRITGSWENPDIEFVRAQALEAVDQRLRNLGRTKDASDKGGDNFGE